MTKETKPFTPTNPSHNKKIDDLIKFYAVERIDFVEELKEVMNLNKKTSDQAGTNLSKSIVK